MNIRDNAQGYGTVTRWVHWLMALAIFFLFGLGYWMVGLEYYSPYYRSAPDLHRSIGLVVGLALVFRLIWRLINIHPSDSELSAWERAGAKAAHWAFYVLIAVLVVSGYMISTTDGRGISVFGLFSVPSLVTDKALTDTMGYIHKMTAYGIMALAGLHAAAAFKHHFADRSSILRRMIYGPPQS